MSKPKNPKNPMRGIFLRGNIYWLASPMKNGQRPPHVTLETGDPMEAQKRAAEIRDHPLLNESRDLGDEIKDFVAYKVRMREWTLSSAKKGSTLTAFAHTQGAGTTAADITTAELQKYHDVLLKRGLAHSSIHGCMMTLRSFFNWAVGVQKIMRRNPLDGVRVVRTEGKARENFAGYELVNRLIREAPDDELRFILFCGFHAGLRKQEIMQARAFWFDLDAGMLHLRKTEAMQFKDREERSIPLTREFLRVHPPLRPARTLHAQARRRAGAQPLPLRLRVPFERYMAAQGVPWLTTHIMRHTFASLLASSGVSILKIAMWLGDDVATVQKHYAKLLPGDKDIEKAFGDRAHTPVAASAG